MGDDALLDHIGTATEAIDAITELREQLSVHPQAPPHVQRPDRDSMLAKAEYHVRGVRDELVAELGTGTAQEVIEEADDGR